MLLTYLLPGHLIDDGSIPRPAERDRVDVRLQSVSARLEAPGSDDDVTVSSLGGHRYRVSGHMRSLRRGDGFVLMGPVPVLVPFARPPWRSRGKVRTAVVELEAADPWVWRQVPAVPVQVEKVEVPDGMPWALLVTARVLDSPSGPDS